MTRRLVMLSLIASVVLWGCNPATETVVPEAANPEAAIPAPSEPVDMLEIPFTAEQIRDEWIEGFTLLMQTSSPSGGAFERWTVLAADDVGAEIKFSPVDAQGNPTSGERQVRLTWEDLRNHGAFPAAMASREEAVRDTALGQLDGWLYKVRDETGTDTEFFFAKSLPGAPVQMKVTKDETLIMELAQIERSRPE